MYIFPFISFSRSIEHHVLINVGTFIDNCTFFNSCLRPLRKHCIPVMKRKTLSEEWNPILYGDFLAAMFSFPLLPSDSWNKQTWKVNQRTFQDQPAFPWRFYRWLLSLLQTPVGECLWATFSYFVFRMVIVIFCLLRFCGSLLDLSGSKMGFLEPKERRVIFPQVMSLSLQGNLL